MTKCLTHFHTFFFQLYSAHLREFLKFLFILVCFDYSTSTHCPYRPWYNGIVSLGTRLAYCTSSSSLHQGKKWMRTWVTSSTIKVNISQDDSSTETCFETQSFSLSRGNYLGMLMGKKSPEKLVLNGCGEIRNATRILESKLSF